ncbi:MAG: peptidoglycan DL-endopeptidase RipB [Solirubrobacteraceae bacterium]|nr:peptidoglycan DL-endopeptidase RipB [Solirubrobacteraceae bacterium]
MARIAGPLAALLLLAGCGAGSSEQLRAWTAAAPYLPPPSAAPVRTPQNTTPVKLKAQAPAPRVAAVKGPVAAPSDAVAQGAPSDAEIRRELRQVFGTSQAVNRASLSSDGLATVPSSAPHDVESIIRAANAVALLPYVYGGGHARWEDGAYDCSGSVSFALAAAGLLKGPLDSTSFMNWGSAGPGRWVTIYANQGHAWMVVAGLRFDTSGLRQGGSRWTAQTRSTAGFVLRHPPGL